MKAYPVYECNHVLSENWVITSNVMLARHFPPEDSHWIGHPPFWTNPNWYLLESTRTQLPSPHSQPSQTARRRDGQWKTDAGEATLPMDLWCGWAACRKWVKTWSCKNHLAGSYCFYIYMYIYIYVSRCLDGSIILTSSDPNQLVKPERGQLCPSRVWATRSWGKVGSELQLQPVDGGVPCHPLLLGWNLKGLKGTHPERIRKSSRGRCSPPTEPPISIWLVSSTHPNPSKEYELT